MVINQHELRPEYEQAPATVISLEVTDEVLATSGIALATIRANQRIHILKASHNKSSRADDAVGQYLNEIGLVPLLSAEEERTLAQIIEQGKTAQTEIDQAEVKRTNIQRRLLDRKVQAGEDAFNHFVLANLRLVVNRAKRYPLPPGMDLLDLVQEGNIGLEHAVHKFDWRKGFKFSTYATFWINQAIERGLDQKANGIRTPWNVGAAYRNAMRVAGGDSEKLDATMKKIHNLKNPTSIHIEVTDDGVELINLLEDPTQNTEAQVMGKIAMEQVREEARDYLALITNERQRRAVELRCQTFKNQPTPYRIIGQELGITGEAARRLTKHGLEAIGTALNVEVAGFSK